MLQTTEPALFQARNRDFSDCIDILDGGFRFAFQPIVDAARQTVVGHEALVRGLDGESAATVIAAIGAEHRCAFDQACRTCALQTAARLGFEGDVHLNCSRITPDNVAVAVAATRQRAIDEGLDPARIVLEFGDLEPLGNPRELDRARQIAHAAGFRVLADNIGCGEVGLKRLAVFRPDFAKLDRSLVGSIENSPRRQAIVHGLIATCRALGIDVIAAGVESAREAAWLARAGIAQAQGFHFGRPTYRPAVGRPANARRVA
jgi:EAL domain-containing protein (putative c-di-GMP-specific phosphodiesterase class I)